MALKSTPTRYGSVVIMVHWLSALVIIALIISGVNRGKTSTLMVKADILKI